MLRRVLSRESPVALTAVMLAGLALAVEVLDHVDLFGSPEYGGTSSARAAPRPALAPGNFNLPLGRRARVVTQSGTRTTTTSALVTYNRGFRVSARHGKAVAVDGGREVDRLDETPFRCHGGLLRLTWYVGNLEPIRPDNSIHLGVMVDGRKVGSVIKGSTRGIWDDSAEHVDVVMRCPAGEHRAWVAIDSLGGTWGIPFANSGDAVQRGFVLQEVWG